MTDTVNTPPAPRPAPEILIAIEPEGDPYSWSDGTTTYTPDDTFYNGFDDPLTFTATVTFYNEDQTAVGYEWDFGDGVTDFGNPVDHTYTVFLPQLQVVLAVTDNFGERFFVSKTVYLTNITIPELLLGGEPIL